MSRHLPFLVPALLATVWLAGPAAAASEIELTGVHSLANQPELSEPVLARSGGALWLRFDARFANPCLAGQGLEIGHLELNAGAAGGALALILLSAAGDGACPDLFRPVEQCLEAELPATLKAVALLEPGGAAARPLILDAGREADRRPGCRQVAASQLLPDAHLPSVARMEVAARPGAGTPSYTLVLDLVLPEPCAGAPLRAQILESRAAPGAPVIDWLLVHTGPCPKGALVTRRATLRHEVTIPAPREVGLLNPLLDADPFPRIGITP